MLDTSSPDFQSIQASAIRLLAMREHSRFELTRKLQNKCADKDVLNHALDHLEQQGLLSDERFIEHYISMRVRKGYGPIRIRAELEERGISGEMTEIWLEEDKDIWFERLQAVAQLKYNGAKNLDQREQGRRARFLQSRGYPESLIRRYLWD